MGIQVNIPDGQSGNWKIDTIAVSRKQAEVFNIRHMRHQMLPGRDMYPGTYKRLLHKDEDGDWETIMSNTPAEVSDHGEFIQEAIDRGGDILINGLGLGMCLFELLKYDHIKSITVVEKSKDVIKLVKPHIKDVRFNVILSDAFHFIPFKRYTTVWHDIWPDINDLNVEEMNLLHEKFELFCDWQGAWARKECEAMGNLIQACIDKQGLVRIGDWVENGKA